MLVKSILLTKSDLKGNVADKLIISLGLRINTSKRTQGTWNYPCILMTVSLSWTILVNVSFAGLSLSSLDLLLFVKAVDMTGELRNLKLSEKEKR